MRGEGEKKSRYGGAVKGGLNLPLSEFKEKDTEIHRGKRETKSGRFHI